MSSYLITGGCGFIASHLAHHLIAQGHTVKIIDNLSTGIKSNAPSNAELTIGDINDEALINKLIQNTDAVFHLAAIASVQQSNSDWIGSHKTNLTGTINILNAARTAKNGKPIPVIYASSAAIYGDNMSLPLSEASTPSPITAYGADKLGCELHSKIGTLVHGVPTMGFRFFNVFGPRQNPDSTYTGVITKFINNLLDEKDLEIYGDGEQIRDFIYVDDVVRFLIRGLEQVSLKPTVFNVCTGKPTSIKHLANVLIEIADKDVGVSYHPERVGDIRRSIGDPSMAETVLGIKAEVGLRDGLAKLYEYCYKETVVKKKTGTHIQKASATQINKQILPR